MREYDDRDEDDDDRSDRGPTPYPTPVKIAGIIWIVFGTIGLVTQVVSMGMNAGQGNMGSPMCGILFAVAFLMIGIQTVQGKAKTSLANGVGSIVFSLIYLGLGAMLLTRKSFLPGQAQNQNPEAESFVLIASLVLLLLGALLFAAGVMAIMGNTDYKAWRAAEGLDRPKRRGRDRRDRDDDYEDDDRRPKRRPRYDDDDDRDRR